MNMLAVLPNYYKTAKYVLFSTQHTTTYVKKLIEDSCTMDETVNFFRVRLIHILVEHIII